jgi:hypothetical protein
MIDLIETVARLLKVTAKKGGQVKSCKSSFGYRQVFWAGRAGRGC